MDKCVHFDPVNAIPWKQASEIGAKCWYRHTKWSTTIERDGCNPSIANVMATVEWQIDRSIVDCITKIRKICFASTASTFAGEEWPTLNGLLWMEYLPKLRQFKHSSCAFRTPHRITSTIFLFMCTYSLCIK